MHDATTLPQLVAVPEAYNTASSTQDATSRTATRLAGGGMEMQVAMSQPQQQQQQTGMLYASPPQPLPTCTQADAAALPAAAAQQQQLLWLPPPPPPRKRVLGRFRRVGCCVCAYDAWHAALVALPTIVATALFLSSVVPHAEAYSYAIAGVLAAGTLLCLLLTVSIDPGIVPPAPAPYGWPAPAPAAALATVTDGNNNNNLASPPQQMTMMVAPVAAPVTVLVRGAAVVCKVCPTCHVLRPPRSSHCRFCDVCVEEFDHHCRVVGGCVGRRTLRFFSGFLLCGSALGLYIFVRTLVVLVRLDMAAARATAGGRWRIAACALCLAICVLFTPLVAPCALQYVYFGCMNLTQKELMRSRRPFALNRPYHRGFCGNLLHRFCAPLGPSRIHGDGYV